MHEQEHVCIKCGLTDPESAMVGLRKQGETEFLSAWVHPRCLGEYRMVAAPFEMKCVELNIAEESCKRRSESP